MKKLTILIVISTLGMASKAQSKSDVVYHSKKGDYTLHCVNSICDTIWTHGPSVKDNKPLHTVDKPEFQKVRVVPLDMYNYLIYMAWEYRENIDYVPSYTPDKKTESRIKMKDNLEAIDKNSKLDSVLVKKP